MAFGIFICVLTGGLNADIIREFTILILGITGLGIGGKTLQKFAENKNEKNGN